MFEHLREIENVLKLKKRCKNVVLLLSDMLKYYLFRTDPDKTFLAQSDIRLYSMNRHTCPNTHAHHCVYYNVNVCCTNDVNKELFYLFTL